MGQKRRKAVEHYPEGGADRRVLETRYGQPTVWDAFLHYLSGNGYSVPRTTHLLVSRFGSGELGFLARLHWCSLVSIRG